MRGFILLFFLFTTINSLFSQFTSGWETQNYFSYTGTVNDLIYFLSNKIVAVGDYGEIYYSENGGIDMKKIPTGFSYHLRSISFKDNSTGYIAGHGGTILKTTDGGKKWENLISGISDNIFDIEVNSNYIIAVGERGKILKSTNDGLTWILKDQNDSYYLLAIKFFNKDTGNAVGSNGTILRTTNAGETWNRQNTGLNFTAQFTDIDTRNDIGIVVGDSGYVLRSLDHGESWTDADTASHTNFGKILYEAKIINDTLIYVVGEGMKVSTDGGNTFAFSYFNNFGISKVKSISVLNPDSVYACGTKGISLFRGSYYDILHFPFHSFDYINLSVLDENNCWISGGPTAKYLYSVYNTTNSGESWNFTKINEYEDDFYSMAFLNIDTGFIMGRINYPGQILRTTDRGTSWQVIRDSTYFWRRSDIRFRDNSLYTIKDYQIHRFDYDGNLIDTIPRPFGLPGHPEVYDFFLIGDSTIYMISGNSLYKSSNNGRNWTYLIQYFYQTEYTDCYFYSEDYGFFVGYNSVILRTTGTNLLEELYTGNPEPDLVFNGVTMSDFYTVHIVGNDGIIYTSTDGGDTWKLIESGVTSDLNQIEFANDKTGWIAGDNGVILKTTTGGTNWENVNNGIPVKYTLYQNYPNPFNPVTTIKFDIPDDIGTAVIRTKLVIYDVIGRQVKVLVDDDLQANSYSYSFDASDLSSGVYFYRLVAGNDFSQTKKMLLIK